MHNALVLIVDGAGSSNSNFVYAVGCSVVTAFSMLAASRGAVNAVPPIALMGISKQGTVVGIHFPNHNDHRCARVHGLTLSLRVFYDKCQQMNQNSNQVEDGKVATIERAVAGAIVRALCWFRRWRRLHEPTLSWVCRIGLLLYDVQKPSGDFGDLARLAGSVAFMRCRVEGIVCGVLVFDDEEPDSRSLLRLMVAGHGQLSVGSVGPTAIGQFLAQEPPSRRKRQLDSRTDEYGTLRVLCTACLGEHAPSHKCLVADSDART